MAWPNVLLAAIAGLGAVILMTLFEFPFWKKWGLEGVAEWQMNSVIVSKTARRSRRTAESPISWMIGGHFFHGTVGRRVCGPFSAFFCVTAAVLARTLVADVSFSFIFLA